MTGAVLVAGGVRRQRRGHRRQPVGRRLRHRRQARPTSATSAFPFGAAANGEYAVFPVAVGASRAGSARPWAAGCPTPTSTSTPSRRTRSTARCEERGQQGFPSHVGRPAGVAGRRLRRRRHHGGQAPVGPVTSRPARASWPAASRAGPRARRPPRPAPRRSAPRRARRRGSGRCAGRRRAGGGARPRTAPVAGADDALGEHRGPVERVVVAQRVDGVVGGPEDGDRLAVHQGARAALDLELGEPAHRAATPPVGLIATPLRVAANARTRVLTALFRRVTAVKTLR